MSEPVGAKQVTYLLIDVRKGDDTPLTTVQYRLLYEDDVYVAGSDPAKRCSAQSGQ